MGKLEELGLLKHIKNTFLAARRIPYFLPLHRTIKSFYIHYYHLEVSGTFRNRKEWQFWGKSQPLDENFVRVESIFPKAPLNKQPVLERMNYKQHFVLNCEPRTAWNFFLYGKRMWFLAFFGRYLNYHQRQRFILFNLLMLQKMFLQIRASSAG